MFSPFMVPKEVFALVFEGLRRPVGVHIIKELFFFFKEVESESSDIASSDTVRPESMDVERLSKAIRRLYLSH